MIRNNTFLTFIFAIILSFYGCANLDEVNERLDNLEQRVDRLDTAVKALQEAYSGGKIITSVSPMANAANQRYGWKITFSDDSSITIVDGEDGVDGITPILKVDFDGYWMISFDGGFMYTNILDSNGNPVKATGKDGLDGVDGVDGIDGTDGIDGIDGKDGMSVRIVINDDGFYVVQIFYESDPDIVISESVTEYSANPATIIESISRDNVNNRVTFTFADGSSFCFPLAGSYASGVVVMSSSDLVLEPGGVATIIFRVNPSDAELNFNVDSDDCQIALDVVDVTTRGSLVVTQSENYTLTSIARSTSPDGTLIPGQFIATITDNNLKVGYVETAAVVVKGVGAGQLSSQPITISSSKLTDMVATGLPTVVIDTPDASPIVSKDEWMPDAVMYIYNADGSMDYKGSLSVKGRGNSTWGLPKKPFALKLDKKSEILGMPTHKRWCLLADYYDETNLRNNLVLWMGNNLSHLDYTPRNKEVNLVLNGVNCGLYLLTEQIKIDENRVNVGDSGFVLEIDVRASEPNETDPFFYVSNIESPIAVKDYDETEESFQYIKNYVRQADYILFSSDYLNPESGWRSMLDQDSFIDWYLINEIVKNNDSNFYSSCYMNVKKDNKIKMGPLWDYDLSMSNYVGYDLESFPNNPEGFQILRTKWYQRLFTDPEFVAAVKSRFEHYYNSRQLIYDYIDADVERTDKAFAVDYSIWRSATGDPVSFRKAKISFLKGWLDQRFEWLKSEFDNM